MRLCIVGAGFTGLTTAYYLTQRDHQVSVFEKNFFFGGLASSFKEKDWPWSLERFYHHLFTSDRAALQLIKELNLSTKLHFYQPDTSVQLNKESVRLCTPFDLLKLRQLNLIEKIRHGAILAFLKLNPFWFPLEKYYASAWLRKTMGKKAFQLIWQPLLKSKFGQYHQQINLTWFWARIKKRRSRFGYLDGGFQILAEALADKIKENGSQIFLKKEIKKITPLTSGQFQINRTTFDKVIVTCPTPVFLKITPQLPQSYHQQLSQLKFLSALNLILILKNKLTNTYWLNITQNWPFVALIEHTNMIDPIHYNGQHLVFLGAYAEKGNTIFKKSKLELLKEWLPYLGKINPNFTQSWLKNSFLFKENFAQPIIGLNHYQKIPAIETPIKNLYLANQSLVYPWDRGINYAIELGKRVAEIASSS